MDRRLRIRLRTQQRARLGARLGALPGRPAVLDLGMAGLLAALSLLLVWKMIAPDAVAGKKLGSLFGSVSASRWHAVAWVVTSCAGLSALPLRRRFPVPVFAVTLAMATAHSFLLGFGALPVDLAVPAAVYTLAATTSRRTSVCVLAAGMLLAEAVDRLAVAVRSPVSGAVAKMLTGDWLGTPTTAVVPAVILVAAWFAGDSSRARQAYLAEVERRARDAERDRDRQAELAASAERARITRELHDVIAHALSVMVIQAQGAGSALRRRQPEDTDEALHAIVTTGRRALAETRRLLGVVRTAEGDPELAPQPGLADLASLVTRVRQAGTPVELRVEGAPRPLAAGLELSAYRIIQEGLTNTIKHGGAAASAVVRVCYGDAEICVEVTDDGAGPGSWQPAAEANNQDQDQDAEREHDGSSSARGHGLPGMRARVAMLGGELVTEPVTTGGFRVRARLPLHVPTAAMPLPFGKNRYVAPGQSVLSARSAADRRPGQDRSPGAGRPRGRQ
jgi:signal transduction histidine kinase